MTRGKLTFRGITLLCSAATLGAMMYGCYAGGDPEDTLGTADGALEPYGSASLTIGGQAYALTWEDDFGGALNGGQAKSYLNANVWRKENLGVNDEQQAYTNRECPNHPTDWNYCVENGKLTLRARKEPLDCVVWKQCVATSECGTNGTCQSGYCLYDQNKNGTWDHDECAPFLGAANPPANGRQYTAGRITTDETVEFRYGYIEFRARMPFAELPAGAVPPHGMWPAIWMLGANGALQNGGRNDGVGWPMTGEIDIMEYTQIKEDPALYSENKAMGFNALWREYPEAGESAANPGGWQPNACSSWPNGGDAKCDGTVDGARAIWDGKTIDYHQWHTWGFLWDENGFKVYMDALPQNGGAPIGTFTIGDGATEYRQPMYLIMNLAVGGELGCLGWQGRGETPGACVNVDWATQGDKAKLEVDYVRWYHRNAGYPQATRAACQDVNGDGTADNVIRNCGFNEDFTYHRSDIFLEGGTGLTEVINEGGTRGYVQWVRIDNSGTQPYSVQVRQEGFQLQGGTPYKWNVDLKANTARTVPIKIAQAKSPWTTVASFNCNVGTTWSTCVPPNFTPPSTDTYKFEIDLGAAGGAYNGTQVHIDNMSLATTTHACQPECTGKLCGSDGCGGTCGTCAAGLTCGSWGQCIAGGGGTGGSGSGGGGADAGTDSGTGGTGGSGGATPVRLEAESATLTGCFAEAGGASGGKVAGFEGSDTICWSNVKMTGITQAKAHVGAPYSGGQAQLKFNGTTLGTLTLGTATGGWSSPQMADISTAVSSSGTGTLCLVGVTHPNGWIYTVDYLDLK
ncbi:glycosyl hydrolase [Polyangium aurulentum]|uniref:glycosyl hydrolase n=1 Tax=Polyangium aurulentum TaxID=2567896 RepID=UPI0010AE0D88|nr:glycosyl hydrolase [Polyangium aurulentum]UQA60577.1 glycosyl hydrolase [Polyangium aurulentum]